MNEYKLVNGKIVSVNQPDQIPNNDEPIIAPEYESSVEDGISYNYESDQIVKYQQSNVVIPSDEDCTIYANDAEHPIQYTTLSSRINNLTFELENTKNSINQEIIQRSTEDEILAQNLYTQKVEYSDGINNLASVITEEKTTRITNDEILAKKIDYVSVSFDDNLNSIEASIEEEKTARIANDSALAQDITTLQVNYNDMNVQLQDVSEVTAGYFHIWNGVDDPELGNLKLEGTVYYQYLGGSLGENNDGWVRTDASAYNYAVDQTTQLAEAINDIEKQIDGVVETITSIDVPVDDTTGEPLSNIEPYKTWYETDIANGNTEQRSLHTGDTYILYHIEGGVKEYDKSWRFAKGDPADDNTDADGFGWFKIIDSTAIEALQKALQANDLADEKRRVFTTQPTTPYDVGDLWTIDDSDPNTKNELYRCINPKGEGESFSQSDWREIANNQDQTAQDILTGAQKLDLAQHLDTIGWATQSDLNSVITDVSNIDTTVSQHTIDIANLDGKISDEEAARIQAINDEQSARIADIAARIQEDANLDGKISDEEAARIQAINDLDAAYKEYSRVVTLAIADGTLTQEELDLISDAQTEVDLAKARFQDIENSVTDIIDGSISINLDSAVISGKTISEYVSDEIDKEVVVYSGTDHTSQTGMKANDLYIESKVDNSGAVPVDVTNIYKYDGANWIQQNTNDNIIALADLADGKRTIYGSNTEPSSPDENDLWIPPVDVGSYVAKELYQYVSGSWIKSVKYTDDSVVDNFISVTYASDKLNMQNQIDGKSVSYFQDTEPFDASSGIESQDGDTWYSKVSKELRQFSFDSKSWELIEDQKAIDAYAAASTAQATADGKIRNFTSEPVPPYDPGDTWHQGASGDIFICQAAKTSGESFSQSDWVIASKYTDDTRVINLETGLENGSVQVNLDSSIVDGVLLTQYISDEVDSQVVVYSGIDHTSQTGMKENDLYIEKTTETGTSGVIVDVVNTYKYDGSNWNQIGNNQNITNLADLADGKRTIYSNTADDVPSGEERDLWIPSTSDATYTKDEIYIRKGSSWVIATKYTADLDSYKSYMTSTVADLQDQLDRKLESYFTTTDPKDSWTTDSERRDHHNDIWFNTDTKQAKRYDYTINNWVAASELNEIMTAASNAQTTADGKITTFYLPSTDTPIDPQQGDYWVQSDKGNKQLTYDGSDWVDLTNKTADEAHDWAAHATKLITGPNGEITGWEFADSSSTQSQFKIHADKFQIQGSSTGLIPFSIDDDEIQFNGKVSFSSVTGTENLADKTYANNAANTAETNAKTYTDDNYTKTNDLGSLAFDDIVEKAKLGTTVIEGGYLKTDLIQANTITLGKLGQDVVDHIDEQGTKADWEFVTGTGKPADNADVTKDEIGGSGINYMHPRYCIFAEDSLPPMTGNTNISLNTSDGVFGSQCLEFPRGDGVDYLYFGSGSTDYNLTIPPGKSWILSFYVKSDTAGATGNIYLRVPTGNTHNYLGNYSATTEWTRISKTIDLSGYDDTKMLFRIDNDTENSTTLFDGFMLEPRIGNKTEPSPFMTPPNFLDDYKGSLTANETYIQNGQIKGVSQGEDTYVDNYDIDITKTAEGGVTLTGVGSTNNITFNASDVGADTVGSAIKSNVAAFGAVPCYDTSDPNVLSYDIDEQALVLYSSSDSTIGTTFLPFRVNTTAGEKFKITIQYKGNANDTDGIYFRVYEYDDELPEGKTHISHNASSSASVCVDDTRLKTWKENGNITTNWVTDTYFYTPTSTAKWASVTILNWDGYGYNKIYIKDISIYHKLGDIAGKDSVDLNTDTTGTLPVSKAADDLKNDLAKLHIVQKLGFSSFDEFNNAKDQLGANSNFWVYDSGTGKAWLNTDYITATSIKADKIDVGDVFAQNVTATGTISGAKLTGAEIETTNIEVFDQIKFKYSGDGEDLGVLGVNYVDTGLFYQPYGGSLEKVLTNFNTGNFAAGGVTIEGAWQAYGGGWQYPSIFKIHDYYVNIQGLVKGGFNDSNTTVLTIDSNAVGGKVPAGSTIHLCACAGGYVRIDVYSDWTIKCIAGEAHVGNVNTWLALDLQIPLVDS